MIALLQRVSEASVKVDGRTIGEINQGVMALIGVEKKDTEAKALRLLERVLSYRMFADAENKMNLSVKDIEGGILLVPQFTLVAETHSGNRPRFSSAASPVLGEALFNYFVAQAKESYHTVATGKFAADMKVFLINDGPVTFHLQVP